MLVDSFEIFDGGLFIKDLDAVVISDTHFGFEESLNREGVFVPRFHFDDVVSRMKGVFDSVGRKVRYVIVNGDLKHVFGKVIFQEEKDVLKFVDFLEGFCEEVVLVKGNHDVMLDFIVGKKNISSVDFFFEKGFYVTHGHLLPDESLMGDIRVVVIGNEHSAVSLSDGVRSEKFKCFLFGFWRGKRLVVMPSFHNLTVGSDVLGGDFLSPYLDGDVSDFDVYVLGDAVYHFGKVKDLR